MYMRRSAQMGVKVEIKSKKGIIYITLGLLFLMLLCTLISRSVYASRLPQITAEEPQKLSISHEVVESGVVRQSREYAISVLGGLKVETVYVGVGDVITEDSLLFTIDSEDLEEQIARQEMEIRKLQEQLKVMKANQNLENTKYTVEQERSEADYNNTNRKNDDIINQEAQKEKQADSALKKHMEQKPVTTSDKDRQNSLRQYESWLLEGSRLEKEVLQNESNLAQWEDKVKEAQKAYEDKQNQTVSGNDLETLKQALTEAIAGRDKSRISYDGSRKALLQHNESAMGKPDYTQEDTALELWNETKKSLEEAVNSSVKAQNDAAAVRQEEALAAGRKVEDARFPQNADSTIAVSEMELAYKKLVLSEYQELLKTGGQVKGKEEGVITAIKVSAGENTPEGAGVVYADIKENLQFVVWLSPEQKRYVNQGMTVTLAFTGSGPIETAVGYIGEENTGYEALINLPDGAAGMGQSGTMTAELKTGSFSQCIPAAALYSEDKRYYIFVVREQEGILGKELAAEKRYVSVTDQNDRYAALADGSLAKGEKVIVTTTSALADGEAVKYRLAADSQ